MTYQCHHAVSIYLGSLGSSGTDNRSEGQPNNSQPDAYWMEIVSRCATSTEREIFPGDAVYSCGSHATWIRLAIWRERFTEPPTISKSSSKLRVRLRLHLRTICMTNHEAQGFDRYAEQNISNVLFSVTSASQPTAREYIPRRKTTKAVIEYHELLYGNCQVGHRVPFRWLLNERRLVQLSQNLLQQSMSRWLPTSLPVFSTSSLFSKAASLSVLLISYYQLPRLSTSKRLSAPYGRFPSPRRVQGSLHRL